ncbi:MAG: endonuclease, partial [Bacteroidota bacterium]
PIGMKLVVNHINSVRNDNRLLNLEIVTQKENINKKY